MGGGGGTGWGSAEGGEYGGGGIKEGERNTRGAMGGE